MRKIARQLNIGLEEDIKSIYRLHDDDQSHDYAPAGKTYKKIFKQITSTKNLVLSLPFDLPLEARLALPPISLLPHSPPHKSSENFESLTGLLLAIPNVPFSGAGGANCSVSK